MSHRARILAWEYSRAPLGPHAVLLILADHAREDGTIPAANAPGIRYLKRRSKYSAERHVLNALTCLVELGELEIVKARASGCRQGYRVQLALFEERACSDNHPPKDIIRLLQDAGSGPLREAVPSGKH